MQKFDNDLFGSSSVRRHLSHFLFGGFERVFEAISVYINYCIWNLCTSLRGELDGDNGGKAENFKGFLKKISNSFGFWRQKKNNLSSSIMMVRRVNLQFN